MSAITAILIGAGLRGEGYANYALCNQDELKIIAVAEPNPERRERFKVQHDIKDENCFDSWEKLLSRPKLADSAIICTQDRMHFEPTMKAMELGYDILLEKPMSVCPEECIRLGSYANEHNRILDICYVLRFTPFFMTLKRLLECGKIGRLISVQHNENVGYWHMAHSFVRGNWSNSDRSSSMILQKSCHDMDILRWLIGADCKNISSFGELTHFKADNAPEGAALRCLDGCKHKHECAYYAPKLYLTEDTGWPASAISNDSSYEARYKALKEGPYGRCVYHCDNNVVDHQVVSMEFTNGVTVAFTMCAFTNEISRTIKLMGTEGEIRGAMEKNEIEVKNFSTGTVEVIRIQEEKTEHGGGDDGIMRDFVSLIQSSKSDDGYCIDESVHSHLMAFAAEKSRLEKKIINMEKYADEVGQ